MFHDEIKFALEGEDFIPFMIPLLEVRSEEDKEKYQRMGYTIGYTRKEWEATYPLIDAQKIFFPPDRVMKSVLYYDKEKFVLFETLLVGTQALCVNPSVNFEQQTLKAIQYYEQDFEKKNFFRLVWHTSGAVKMHLVRDIILNEQPSPALYEFFIGMYKKATYGAVAIDAALLQKLQYCKSEEQIAKTNMILSSFGANIVVYRGIGDRSTPVDKAMSWTTDKAVACSFASKGKKHWLLKGEVEIKDVFEYIETSEESELLILPNQVKKIEKMKLMDIEDVLDRWNAKAYKELQEFCEYLIREVPESKSFAFHQKEHCARVLFWTIVLAWDERLDEKSKEILYSAAIYHDCGRVDDEPDREHGNRGAEIFKCLHPERADVAFLIKYHSLNDEEGHAALANSGLKNKEQIWRLYTILKDADALDRVRLRPQEFASHYLRNQSVDRYIGAAFQLAGLKLL